MSDLKNFKCPACGGTLEFNSKLQKMKCPYCDTEIDMDSFTKSKEYENHAHEDSSFNEEKSAGGSFDENEKANLECYICQSCSGQIIVPKETGATSCPFCGNPQIIPHTFEGSLRPDFIIPFKLDRKDVKEHYFRHLKGKHFLPKAFKDENHFREIKGVYVPFWLFDGHVRADMCFECERIEQYEDSDLRYVKHLYYEAFRSGSLKFYDVPADGSKIMNDDLMESLEPFLIKDAIPYSGAYLSGYMASRYDVSEEENRPRIKERMQNSTYSEFRNTVNGYNRVNLKNADYRFKKLNARYVLLPVWILSTTWRDQRYLFAMNGQTGSFVGNLPRDDRAFYSTFAVLTVIMFMIISVISYIFITG